MDVRAAKQALFNWYRGLGTGKEYGAVIGKKGEQRNYEGRNRMGRCVCVRVCVCVCVCACVCVCVAL